MRGQIYYWSAVCAKLPGTTSLSIILFPVTHEPKSGDWSLLRMSNILNLHEKLTKSVLTVAVLRLRNIFVTFSHIFSILALLATVQSPFLG